jgi:hypothetical protein
MAMLVIWSQTALSVSNYMHILNKRYFRLFQKVIASVPVLTNHRYTFAIIANNRWNFVSVHRPVYYLDPFKFTDVASHITFV